jgi:ketosteroid isomerase-like protein
MTDRIQNIEDRLQKLEDIEEIRRLRMRYHVFINEGFFDRFPELFLEDALVDFSYIGQAKGHGEIRELFLRIPRNLDLVVQFIHNHVVDVDGDEATGLSFLDARYAQDGESVMLAAKFDEIYRRTPAGWRIGELHLHLYFMAPITAKGWAGKQTNMVNPLART